MAEFLGVPRVARADPEFVRQHTGQVIGGVAPIGHPEPIGTLVDVELARYDAGLGRRRASRRGLPDDFDELLRLTGGTAAEVGGAAPPRPARR